MDCRRSLCRREDDLSVVDIRPGTRCRRRPEIQRGFVQMSSRSPGIPGRPFRQRIRQGARYRERRSGEAGAHLAERHHEG